MFRAALFSLLLSGGLARARPDGLRGRSYSNPNTCPCPPEPASTGESSVVYLPATTIRETVTECITVTEPAITKTVYESITQDHDKETDPITRTRSESIVIITRTVGESAEEVTVTTSEKERTTSTSGPRKTITVTYHDGSSETATHTRHNYETQPPSGYNGGQDLGYNDGQDSGYDDGETGKGHDAPEASSTVRHHDYGTPYYPDNGKNDGKKDDGKKDDGKKDDGKKDDGKKDDGKKDDGKKDDGKKDDGKKVDGKKDDGDGYIYPEPSSGGYTDNDHPYPAPSSSGNDGYTDNGHTYPVPSGGNDGYTDNAHSYPAPSSSGNDGYADNGHAYPAPSSGGNDGYTPQPSSCSGPPRPGRPCITTITSGTVTEYQTIYPSPETTAGSVSPDCTLTTKVVTSYQTVVSTIRPTDSASIGFSTGLSPTGASESGLGNSSHPATNETAQQTDTYLHYSKREPRGSPSRFFGLNWW